ncbi:MAG TPA: hypothetical protein VNA89_05505 [Gemmatimonadaceae bacterium]|nr:hypothetical protein [Gemmatimonadaceae bacterium]
MSPTPSVPHPADDLSKAERYAALAGRIARLMPRVVPGAAGPEVVQELDIVRDGLESLLAAGPPMFPFYDVCDVSARIADCEEFAARACESIGDDAAATMRFDRAAAALDRAGRPAEAERCRARARALRTADSDPEDEVRRLRGLLDAGGAASLATAATIVDLAEATSRAGDDFEAEHLFRSAVEMLRALGYDDGNGSSPAPTLIASIVGILGGTETPGSTAVERVLAARGLFLRAYLGLVRVYGETDRERAEEYDRRIARMRAALGPGSSAARPGGSRAGTPQPPCR